jgi:glycosyltransferase involved in cell wall biosynthesis
MSRIVVAGTDPTGRGGVATSLSGLLAELEEQDELAGFLCTHRSYPRARFTPLAQALLALPSALPTRDPILFAHTGGPLCVARTSALAARARTLGAHVVIQLHSAAIDPWLTGPRRHILKRLLSPAHRLIAGTEHYAERYQQAGLRDVHVLAPSLPPDARTAAEAPIQAASSQDSLHLACLSRLADNKGLDLLIRAMVHLPNDRLTLGGDGPSHRRLVALAQQLGVGERVNFAGWVEDRSAFFHGVDLYIAPSSHDTYGLAPLEAMARGIPAITIDTPVTMEVVGSAAMRIDATANHISDSVNTLRSTRGSRARASQAWVRQKLEQRHVLAALVG